jgi:glutaredoxin
MFFVYGGHNSPASDKAEFILHALSYPYKFYVFRQDYTLNQLQKLVPNAKTIPHIFHGAKYIGGVQDLYDYIYSNEVNDDTERKHAGFSRKLDFNVEDFQDDGDIHKD